MAGSGSLVDGTIIGFPHHCLLTNHHVLKTADVAADATVIFNYVAGKSQIRVRLSPNLGFVAREVKTLHKTLDYAIVAIDLDDIPKLPCEPIPLVPGVAVHDGRPITIWQHPNGDHRVSAMWNLKSHTASALEYDADTEPGSSGSPVYDNMCNLIGGHYQERATMVAGSVPSLRTRRGGSTAEGSTTKAHAATQSARHTGRRSLFSEALALSTSQRTHWITVTAPCARSPVMRSRPHFRSTTACGHGKAVRQRRGVRRSPERWLSVTHRTGQRRAASASGGR